MDDILKPIDAHLQTIMDFQVKKWMELIKENDDDVEVPPSVTLYYFRKMARQ
jgi:hypothetical protein